MPPVVVWALGALGALVAARWLVREYRRINAELDAARTAPVGDAVEPRSTLKRDPETGIYHAQ